MSMLVTSVAALDKISQTFNNKIIDQIILASPDIDIKEFEDLAAHIERVAKGVTLYASSNDFAMKVAR